MAKKLNYPRKSNKNLGTKQRGLGMLINSEPETQQKENEATMMEKYLMEINKF